MRFGFSGTREVHYRKWCLMKSVSCIHIHALSCSSGGNHLPFVSVLFGWASLVSCLSIKRSLRMSRQGQPVWPERLPLAFPCCQTPLPAEGFGLMMSWVRGHYPSETCSKGCCSPHFPDWPHLQRCCSLSKDKGSGWEKKQYKLND